MDDRLALSAELEHTFHDRCYDDVHLLLAVADEVGAAVRCCEVRV